TYYLFVPIYLSFSYLFFFFQAEDGIRDLYVTGVQTCALPIFFPMRRPRDQDTPHRNDRKRTPHGENLPGVPVSHLTALLFCHGKLERFNVRSSPRPADAGRAHAHRIR